MTPPCQHLNWEIRSGDDEWDAWCPDCKKSFWLMEALTNLRKRVSELEETGRSDSDG